MFILILQMPIASFDTIGRWLGREKGLAKEGFGINLPLAGIQGPKLSSHAFYSHIGCARHAASGAITISGAQAANDGPRM